VALLATAVSVLARGSLSAGQRLLFDRGQVALRDERTHDLDFKHGEKPFGPRDCNVAFAMPLYRHALSALFTLGSPNARPLTALTAVTARTSYVVNGVQQNEAPFLVSQLPNLEPEFRLVHAGAMSKRTLVFKFDLRITVNDTKVVLPGVLYRFRLDHNCQVALSEQSFTVSATLPAAVHALLVPQSQAPKPTTLCPAGESASATGACVVVSCLSARACPGQPCRATRSSYTCGCASGYAANNHTLECVAVNCTARDACPPYATCQNLPEAQLDDCNPTPTLGFQWRRGAAPCPRFVCVPMTAPTSATSATPASTP